jgi:hypothetical protein
MTGRVRRARAAAGRVRRPAVAVLLAALVGGGGFIPAVPSAAAAPAGHGTLAGGGAAGQGVFVTYSDRDLVIEGGTVAAPDFGAPTAEATIDLTGLGSALAALGYSPYSDAAGVLNAFGGTELPVGSVGERSRAKVAGRPPQESAVTVPGSVGPGSVGPGSVGQAKARLVDGPTADASSSVAHAPGAVAVQAGEARATVATVSRTADSKVTVVLRRLRIGEDLHIDTVTLTANALADDGAGVASASVVVEGVTLRGTPVRLTPRGLEPAGAAPPDLSALHAAGIEVLSAGETEAKPGGRQAEARASGPRLRFRSSDGRLLTIVLGRAAASSTWAAGQG